MTAAAGAVSIVLLILGFGLLYFGMVCYKIMKLSEMYTEVELRQIRRAHSKLKENYTHWL